MVVYIDGWPKKVGNTVTDLFHVDPCLNRVVWWSLSFIMVIKSANLI